MNCYADRRSGQRTQGLITLPTAGDVAGRGLFGHDVEMDNISKTYQKVPNSIIVQLSMTPRMLSDHGFGPGTTMSDKRNLDDEGATQFRVAFRSTGAIDVTVLVADDVGEKAWTKVPEDGFPVVFAGSNGIRERRVVRPYMVVREAVMALSSRVGVRVLDNGNALISLD